MPVPRFISLSSLVGNYFAKIHVTVKKLCWFIQHWKWPLWTSNSSLYQEIPQNVYSLFWCNHTVSHHGEISPRPMRKSDKLMNYWEHRGRQTKSESHASQSLLHPICSQRIPPKIDSLLTQPDTLCEGERKWEIKGWRMGGQGAPLAKNMSRSSSLDRFPQWSFYHLQKYHICGLE